MVKRSLTSLQISQFIIGASAAMVHSFISYLVPVQVAGSGTKYQKINCIDTTGKTFAIWLNVTYLAPLTYLFVSFFIASYLRRSKAEIVRRKTDRRCSNNVALAEKASWDAARGIEREMYGESTEGVIVEDSDESTSSSEVHLRVNGVKANGVKMNGKKHQ